MQRFSIFAAVCGTLLLLTGCQHAATDSSSESSAAMTDITEGGDVANTQPADTLPTDAGTAAVVNGTTDPLATAQSILTTQQKGGQGGEEHAEDIDPLYFDYRFSDTGVSMRLAGGNYQTINYNFSRAIEHDVDSLYTLDDFNFDGNPDLAVPVEFDNANVTYAIFLWNPESFYYEEEPILIVNPVPYADSQIITSLERESASLWMMTTFTFTDGILMPYIVKTADYEAMTLTTEYMDYSAPTVVDQYDSTEALEAALLAQ